MAWFQSPHAAKGRAALARLARAGDAAAGFIAAQLKDLSKTERPLTAKRLEGLVADLDNDEYETRERATKELAGGGCQGRRHLAAAVEGR